jgi:hypothetical protein
MKEDISSLDMLCQLGGFKARLWVHAVDFAYTIWRGDLHANPASCHSTLEVNARLQRQCKTPHPLLPTSPTSSITFLFITQLLAAPIMPPKQVSSTTKTPKKKSIPWDQDGVDGGNSSITIILDWLGTGTNYLQWLGDLESGTTKTWLCSEILQIMKDSRITHR